MRLFVLLRSVFFVVLLTASLVFVAHTHLCINYAPHELEGFLRECKASIDSISQVNPYDSYVIVSNRTVRSAENISQNSTSNIEKEEDEVNGNITLIEKWHRIPSNDEIISVNVKTCFDFSIKEILRGSVPKNTDIVSPLRLTLILIVTSFLVSILDLSSRMIIHKVSLIQCLAHSFVQIVLWGSILVNMEMYRRDWVGNWLNSGQSSTEIPMYPTEWTAFEMHAFIIMFLSILDSVLFDYLSKNIKLEKSQGVYKVIQSNENAF